MEDQPSTAIILARLHGILSDLIRQMEDVRDMVLMLEKRERRRDVD